MKPIAVFGAGGFGREVEMLIEQINDYEETWQFIGFFDDSYKKNSSGQEGKIIGGRRELNNWKEELSIVIAIGNPKIKKDIVDSITNQKVYYPILVHPNVQIGKTQKNIIGEGCIITSSNVITVNTAIGKHVILNLACTVGHDAQIGDYCSVMPGVNISGEVNIGHEVFIGTGAKIINQVSIGNNTLIGAGSVITKDLPSNCTAVGVPAKPVKFH